MFLTKGITKVQANPTHKYRLKPRRGGVWPNSPTTLRSDGWPSFVNYHLQAIICILSLLQQMFSGGVKAKKNNKKQNLFC